MDIWYDRNLEEFFLSKLGFESATRPAGIPMEAVFADRWSREDWVDYLKENVEFVLPLADIVDALSDMGEEERSAEVLEMQKPRGFRFPKLSREASERQAIEDQLMIYVCAMPYDNYLSLISALASFPDEDE